jgi:hypothetical protein
MFITLAQIHHLLLIPQRSAKFTTPILPNLSGKSNFFEHRLPDFAVQKPALNDLYVPQHTFTATCAAGKPWLRESNIRFLPKNSLK